MIYVYTSVLAVYVFDSNFAVIKEKTINDSKPLESFDWLAEEKQIIDTYIQKDKITFVGKKNKKYRDIIFCNDLKVVNRVLKASKHHFDKHFKHSLDQTKKEIAASVTKDFLLIQTINSINELEKTINLLTKRVREMYRLYGPRIEQKLNDNTSFIRLITSKSKQALEKELELSNDMDGALKKDDADSILQLAGVVEQLIAQKETKEIYLEELVSTIAPNVVAIAGDKIASKMIAIAGSVKKLAFFPAGTIQTLGAEKALFNHLKNKSRPPKYGVIINHPLVNKAPAKKRGKVARDVANKISLAAKVDYFDKDKNYIGYQLAEKLEKGGK